MSDWTKFYTHFFKEWTDDIISTKELVNKAYMFKWGIEAELAKELIQVKSSRALTQAIKVSSKSSDRLALIWLLLTAALVFLWFVELQLNPFTYFFK